VQCEPPFKFTLEMLLLTYLLCCLPTARTGKRLGEIHRVIDQELQRSFSDAPSILLEPVDSCQSLFTSNIERSCAHTDSEYQLGQVPSFLMMFTGVLSLFLDFCPIFLLTDVCSM